MMNRLKLYEWEFDHDHLLTSKVYKDIGYSSSDLCGCESCQYFKTHRMDIYPDEFLRILRLLGISHNRETEVFLSVKPATSIIPIFQGWFHFVGKMSRGNYVIRSYHTISENFSFRIVEKKDMAFPIFNGYDVLQLEFRSERPELSLNKLLIH